MTRFAIGLTHFLEVGRSPQDWLQDMAQQVRLAREVGFDELMMGHHFASEAPSYHNLLTMARLSAEAPDMGLFATVLVPLYHHPVALAEYLTTLDMVCGGRLKVGAYPGWRQREYDLLDVPWEGRLGRFLESLEILRRLWTEDHVTHQGKHFQFTDLTVGAKPVSKPHPPLFLGASREPAARRAGRLGYPFINSALLPWEVVRYFFSLYHEERQRAGHPSKEVYLFRQFYVAKDEETAWREGGPHISQHVRAFAGWGFHDAVGQRRGETSEGESTPDRVLCGSPQQCAQNLVEMVREVGATGVALSPFHGLPQEQVLECIRLTGEEVIPRVREATSRG